VPFVVWATDPTGARPPVFLFIRGTEGGSLPAVTDTSGQRAEKIPRVAIIMGSRNDWSVMKVASDTLRALDVAHEARVVSAHRTPDRMFAFAEAAEGRGLQVIIAGAGGAAHLPGMVAAKTTLPVLGVPIPATVLKGLDALLSIVQMPKGIPVGTLAIGEPGAVNAALLAAAIVARSDAALAERLRAYRAQQTASVADEILA